jgi:hypothetical protein
MHEFNLSYRGAYKGKKIVKSEHKLDNTFSAMYNNKNIGITFYAESSAHNRKTYAFHYKKMLSKKKSLDFITATGTSAKIAAFTGNRKIAHNIPINDHKFYYTGIFLSQKINIGNTHNVMIYGGPEYMKFMNNKIIYNLGISTKYIDNLYINALLTHSKPNNLAIQISISTAVRSISQRKHLVNK